MLLKKYSNASLSACLEESQPMLRVNGDCHSVWKSVFGSQPPRVTFARICKTLGINHDVEIRGYIDQTDFIEQLTRLQMWYSEPRRAWRR
jgi:hypothetical protein